MTEPSQYFKGRTVQEQMDEVIGYVDQRSAEVATAAIASDVAQVHQDMLDAGADAAAAAASAAAAAGTLANAVKKTGEASQSIAGDIAVAGTLSGGVVTGTQVTVPTPVNDTDAANKKYVDDADALKANKTYVDAQDALMIPITNINSYAVGLTDNQPNIAGNKGFLGNVSAAFFRTTGADGYRRINIDRSDDDLRTAPASSILYPLIAWNDRNNNLMSAIYVSHLPNGTTSISVQVRNSDGSIKYATLAQGDVI